MPIFEALRNQEKETAVSVHFMNGRFDEGAVILKENVPILVNETYGELAIKMSQRTAMVALNIAQMLQFASSIPRTEQDEDHACYFDKPQMEETFIYWKSMSAGEIISLINACNPWNQGADTILFGKNVKLVAATISDQQHVEPPGKVLELTKNGAMAISCIDGQVIDVQIVAGDFGILSAGNFMAKNFTLNYSFN
jgi:methionyl-tRNA formyltransferase